MRGIAGIVDFGGKLPPGALEPLALQLRESLTHRGPDDAGIWLSEDGRVALTHRRLSIIDLSPEGAQPMRTPSGSVVLTLNGEIYNYRDLTADLQARGCRFRTRTDSEALLHLLDQEEPEAALEQIRGMYAFAAWKPEENELFLARDPFGKKPLYYALGDGILAFASELRALELVPGLCESIDPLAVQEYLLLQYVHAPRTIYTDVHKLEPGSYVRFQFPPGGSPTGGKSTRHFAFDAEEPETRVFRKEHADVGTAVQELKEILTEAVEIRLASDVPLGAFLSGGVDSSLVVSIMAKELGVPVKTFSIGFEGSPDSEHEVAAEIAGILGTEHHERCISPSAVDLLPEIVAALDEPNGDSSCLPVYLLSQFTRDHVTVALSGDGGDEMFGGYGRYGDTIHEATDRLRHLRSFKRERRLYHRGSSYVSGRVMMMSERRVTPMTGPLAPEVVGMLERWRYRVGQNDRPLILAMRTLDARSYLPGAVLAKVDRMSMHYALEVRCPFLDSNLANWAARIPAELCHDGEESKRLLKMLTRQYLPSRIVDRPKYGFGLPEKLWSKERLLGLAQDLVLSPGSRLGDCLDRKGLAGFFRLMEDPRHFSIYQVWGVLVLEAWLRECRVPVRVM